MAGRAAILVMSVVFATGCARRWKADDGASACPIRPWPMFAHTQRADRRAERARPARVDPDAMSRAVAVSLDEVEQAIRTFQDRRRERGPAMDTAWPVFLEMVEAYLDQAPEGLSLSPLIHARIAAEYELDQERRRPVGAAPELERLAARLILRIDRKVRVLRRLAASAERDAAPAARADLHWPLSGGVITSGFGARRDPFDPSRVRFHAGVDLSARPREPVGAARAGSVIQAGWAGSSGRTVRIRHAEGFETVYSHLAVVMVRVGQPVSAGDVIGLLGASGRATGPHLHFAVYHDGKAVDPLEYLKPIPLHFSDLTPGIVFGTGE